MNPLCRDGFHQDWYVLHVSPTRVEGGATILLATERCPHCGALRRRPAETAQPWRGGTLGDMGGAR